MYLHSQELTAFNVAIANQGNEFASNVVCVVKLPDSAEVHSLEIAPSEAALKYKVTTSESDKSRIEVGFPNFPSNVDCIFSFLTRLKAPAEIEVSITGEKDVIGKFEKGISEYEVDRSRRRLLLTHGVSMASALALVLIISGLMTTKYINYTAAMTEMSSGDLYYTSGNYELALDSYTKINVMGFEPTTHTLRYRIARTYAQLNRSGQAVTALNILVEKNGRHLAVFALLDPAFDKIRETTEFTEFTKQMAVPSP